MMKKLTLFLLLAFSLLELSSCKTYSRCELARELKYVHGIHGHRLAKWVCIAKYESNYNTSAISPPNTFGDRDFGIFQINDAFWCSRPGKGCNIKCSQLTDSNITDDVICAQRIYEETKRLRGNGFIAWNVYYPHCRHFRAHKFLADCF